MELISKKDLLEATGISYSALYRWKRKGLIPEDWFIRKSTFTGQETFFPRDKILPRINKIVELKENLSLGDLAETFTEPVLSCEKSQAEKIISPPALELLGDAGWGSAAVLDAFALAQGLFIQRLLDSGLASRDEAGLALQTIWKAGGGVRGRTVSLYRKQGVTFCVVGADEVVDDGAKLVFSAGLDELAHEAAVKMKGVAHNESDN